MLKFKVVFIENRASSGAYLINSLKGLGYRVSTLSLKEHVNINNQFEDDADLVILDLSGCPDDNPLNAYNSLLNTRSLPVLYYYERINGNQLPEIDPLLVYPFSSEELEKLVKSGIHGNTPANSSFSPDFLEKVLNSIGEAVILTDCAGNVSCLNPLSEVITGFRNHEAIGRPLKEVFSLLNPVIPGVDNMVSCLIQTGERISSKDYSVIVTKDGTRKMVEFNLNSVRENDGTVSGAILTFREVSERIKKDHDEINKFKFAIQHSNEIIFMTDKNGIINYVNPQFERFYGYSTEEAIGETPQIIKSGLMSYDFYKQFWTTLLSGKNFNEEIVNKTKAGKLVNVEASTSPIYDEFNNLSGFISIQRDIVEKKQNEELLRLALDKAEESDKLKTAFLNQMSHEIRTPLNSILGFMSLMEEELVNKGMSDLVRYFDSINRSAGRLQRTIEDILAMSSIQIGNFYTTVTRINIENIITLLMSDFNSLAIEKNLEFVFRNEVSDPTIYADSYTVTQSFQHIIDNALKFTNKGRVEVIIYLQDGNLCVDFKDTGIGISREYMDNLFKPFSQEEIGYNRRYDGNGLGLAITKEYLRLNHATIKVESEKEVGSTFTVTFYPVNKNEDVDS